MAQPSLPDMEEAMQPQQRKNTAILELPDPSSLGDKRAAPRIHHARMHHRGVHVQDMIASEYDRITRLPVLFIVLAAMTGIGLALLLDGLHLNRNLIKWIALPGDLFTNALKGIVGPLIFCNIALCIGELIELGKVRAVATRTAVYFVISSIVASSLGVLMGWCFLGQFRDANVTVRPKVHPVLSLTCPSGGDLAVDARTFGGVLRCLPENATVDDAAVTTFHIKNPNKFFIPRNRKYVQLSETDLLIEILYALIPENFFAAFQGPTTLGIVTIAIILGTALSKAINRRHEEENFPLLLIRQANVICRMLVNYVLWVIPVAIVSMIAGSIAKDSASLGQLVNVGWLALALLAGLVLFTVGFLGLVFFFTTRTSIFHYLKHIVPAMVFIFGCSSSIATLPITLRCVENSRQVSPALTRFIVPIGAASSLNGTAVYMPLACIFMAKISGHEGQLTLPMYVLLALSGAVSSFGVAPVPHSGLVMAMVIWRALFGTEVPPLALTLLLGSDWILNRLRAIVNVTSDAILCRIIAEQCDEANFRRTPAGPLNDVDDRSETGTRSP